MLEVLLEDNHCLAVNKPAGLLSQGDVSGDASLVDLAADYLRHKYAKPGNVFVGLVHRLDRPVSGVVLLARTSKAADRLSAQFREGTVRKTYWALVEGMPEAREGTLRDWLRKDAARNVVDVVPEGTAGGHPAELDFRVIGREVGGCLLEIRPRTGRGHQIRVQLAARGWPIIGDRKYGARRRVAALDGGERIGLHALRLGFTHPTSKQELEVMAPLPADWPGSTRPE